MNNRRSLTQYGPRQEETVDVDRLLLAKDLRIKALEYEIRCLRNVLANLKVDSRFWIGLPIGPKDDACEALDESEK